ncbi:MAG: MucB/RseB C-terminal domain-containing protein, partial [Steroidobacteraceae bacterium]
MERGAHRFAVACLLTLAWSAAQAQQHDARRWLERMSEALATRSYDGLFTHSTGGQTESMRIVHRVDRGRSLERLVSLDGSGREVVRTREEIHAYLPDRKVVLVEPRGDDGLLLKALPTPGPGLDRYYELTARDGNRILGREIIVIDVRPKDAYRYGYRLWLDKATAMPLRSVVGDGAGRQVEQILFTRLEMKERIPASDTEPSVDASGFQWVRNDRRLTAMPQLAGTGWRPVRVPPGFRLVASRLQLMSGSPMPAQHLIFSDGIAAISVFIEPAASGGPRPPEASSMCSANAYSTRVRGHVVTAVGEVP